MAEPITNICIVDKKSNCPPGYQLIDRTKEGEDADLWKDGMFRAKVTRYICFTKSVTENQWNHIATNIILIGLKDAVPQGYTALRETVDTKEPALRKHTMCIQYVPKSTTSSGISEIIITKSNSFRAENYTNVGEVNNTRLCFKLTPLPRMVTRPAPPAPVEKQLSPLGSSAPPLPQRQPLRVQNSAPKTADSPMSGIAGVPFKLHDKFLNSDQSQSPHEDLNITIKTKSELDNAFSYDFSKERSIAVRHENILGL